MERIEIKIGVVCYRFLLFVTFATAKFEELSASSRPFPKISNFFLIISYRLIFTDFIRANKILELIKKFRIDKLDLMVFNDYDGVLEPIHYVFVFKIT